MRKPAIEFRQRLSIGQVDVQNGKILGAVAAKANTPAVGHFAFKKRDGSFSLNPKDAIEKLQIRTDPKFLEQLVESAKSAGGQLKVRIDHDDSLNSRVGFANNFRLEGDVVRCDISVYKNSEQGPLVLEAAQEDSKNIGLSVEFEPLFEERDGFAYFRVGQIFAVDIVDQGAVTPDGMFLSVGVDKGEEVISGEIPHKKNSKDNIMPDAPKDPTPAELAAQITALTATVSTLTQKLEAFTAPKADAPKPDAPKPDAPKEEEALNAKLEKLVDGKVALALQKRESALGLRSGEGLSAPASGDGKQPDAKEKSYLETVSEKVVQLKISKPDAHAIVQKENPELYRKHNSGIFNK